MKSYQTSDDVGSAIEPTPSAPIFKRLYLIINNTLALTLFCTAEIMLRIIIKQNSRLVQACFPSKIIEVWIDRFRVRYEWWRRLHLMSSVSPVWKKNATQFNYRVLFILKCFLCILYMDDSYGERCAVIILVAVLKWRPSVWREPKASPELFMQASGC